MREDRPRPMQMGIHTWLRSLTNESHGKELEGILSETPKLSNEHKKLADGVINVYVAANIDYMHAIKESDSIMSEAVNELLADWTLKEKREPTRRKKELRKLRQKPWKPRQKLWQPRQS